ncbi:MAG: glycoside hydrolase family 32 protein [Verrucomicrobiales bacterium]|nr:glycoside hydrolase family 32 protein [Verrucomicrobiales bacterium]
MDNSNSNRESRRRRRIRCPGILALGILIAAGGRVSAAEDILTDFEGPDFGGWTVTGDAFGTAPATGALPDQAPVGGFRGRGFASSFHGRDKATGRLTSPEFTLNRRYLNFLIGGGEEVGATCVNVLVEGAVVRSATGREDEFLNTATFDLGEFAGKKARIEIVDAFTGSWGHINADHFVLSDTAAVPPFVQNPPPPPPFHDEALRPQFHFTAHSNWLNDPNGLIRAGGEYHLFFQHNPQGREWGNMTWGHATSPDLVRWKEGDPALLPDRHGTMFSGSVVVDTANTAGFQSGKDPALVAIYTAAGGTSRESEGQPFSQCLAYSNDQGHTWTKFEGNPVLKAVGDGDRDPKVFWHAPSALWVMPLYVGVPDPARKGRDGKPAVRNTCQFFTSPDLKSWTHTGTFAGEVYECPGLVELPVDGNSSRTRWVLWGADGAYWVGVFDGRNFVADAGPVTGDYGPHFYAAQAWDALPDRRVVLIGWMRGGVYPDMPFNQQMGFPMDLSLQSSTQGIRLVKWPVPEIRNLFASVLREDLPRPTPVGTNRLGGAIADTLDLEFEFQPGDAREVRLDLRGVPLGWDAASGNLRVLGKTIPSPVAPGSVGRRSDFPAPWGPDLVPWDRSVRWRILVDRTSLEIFVNGGTAVGSFCWIPREEPSLAVVVEGGTLARARLVRRTLKSAWRP